MRRPEFVGREDGWFSDKSLLTAPSAVDFGNQIRRQAPIRLGLGELDRTVGSIESRDRADSAVGRPCGEASKILVASDPLWIINGIRVRQSWNFGTRPNRGSISSKGDPHALDRRGVSRADGVLHERRVARRVDIVIGGFGGYYEII